MKRLPAVIVIIVVIAAIKYSTERRPPSAPPDSSSTPSSPPLSKPPASKGNEKELADGLRYEDFAEGKGPAAQNGDVVKVHYTGWLVDGKQFDSNVESGKPYDVPIGQGSVIKGWDLGLVGMKAGTKRKLVIPPHLGYREEGQPPDIPGNATLIFLVELLEIVGPAQDPGKR